MNDTEMEGGKVGRTEEKNKVWKVEQRQKRRKEGWIH